MCKIEFYQNFHVRPKAIAILQGMYVCVSIKSHFYVSSGLYCFSISKSPCPAKILWFPMKWHTYCHQCSKTARSDQTHTFTNKSMYAV